MSRANTAGTLLDAIREWTAEHGYPPSQQDLMTMTGITHWGLLTGYLRCLHDLGYLRHDPGMIRGLVVTRKRYESS